MIHPFLCHVSNIFQRAIVKLTSVVLLIRQERFQQTFSNESAEEPSIIHIHQKNVDVLVSVDYQPRPLKNCLLLPLSPLRDICGVLVRKSDQEYFSTGSILSGSNIFFLCFMTNTFLVKSLFFLRYT